MLNQQRRFLSFPQNSQKFHFFFLSFLFFFLSFFIFILFFLQKKASRDSSKIPFNLSDPRISPPKSLLSSRSLVLGTGPCLFPAGLPAKSVGIFFSFPRTRLPGDRKGPPGVAVPGPSPPFRGAGACLKGTGGSDRSLSISFQLGEPGWPLRFGLSPPRGPRRPDPAHGAAREQRCALPGAGAGGRISYFSHPVPPIPWQRERGTNPRVQGMRCQLRARCPCGTDPRRAGDGGGAATAALNLNKIGGEGKNSPSGDGAKNARVLPRGPHAPRAAWAARRGQGGRRMETRSSGGTEARPGWGGREQRRAPPAVPGWRWGGPILFPGLGSPRTAAPKGTFPRLSPRDFPGVIFKCPFPLPPPPFFFF